MSLDFKSCSICNHHKIIPVEEKQSKFILNNPEGLFICKVQVDGCLFKSGTKKCDWLFIVHKKETNEINKYIKSLIFVELKGCNLKDAIEQLEITIKNTLSAYPESLEKRCYAVTSRIPKADSDMRKRKIDFHKQTRGAQLFVKNIISEANA